MKQFYYHLGLHYSQTCKYKEQGNRKFYYHLGLHYSQTDQSAEFIFDRFYYHLGLHYSQTLLTADRNSLEFYYHLGLHYSQTSKVKTLAPMLFYYHLGLHYSQTQYEVMKSALGFYYHLGLHYSQTSNFKTAGISFGKMGKLAVFLRFGAALRHYSRVSGGSKTIIAHESKFAKVFVDDPHLLTGSDRLFLSALQQENGQFFIKHRLIKKRYFILRKE